jgi:hypothetical protein
MPSESRTASTDPAPAEDSGPNRPSGPVAEETGGSGGRPEPRPRRKPSGLRRIPGKRPMKEYPLTKGDMRDLAKTGAAATACFAVASGFFGFMVNLAKDLSLAQAVPEKVVAFWNAIWWSALVGAVIFAAFGAAALIDGRLRLREIERETEHDAD